MSLLDDSTSIINYSDYNNLYSPNTNKSLNILTIYEKTAVIGLRKQQIANGAPSTLDKDTLKKLNSLDEIVSEEMNKKVLPFIISRKMPNGTKEYWKVKDLIDIQMI
jgi:DNA-directed RNA polymerase subunit K/omega